MNQREQYRPINRNPRVVGSRPSSSGSPPLGCIMVPVRHADGCTHWAVLRTPDIVEVVVTGKKSHYDDSGRSYNTDVSTIFMRSGRSYCVDTADLCDILGAMQADMREVQISRMSPTQLAVAELNGLVG